MFHILGFIFFLVLIVLTIGFFILWRIVNTFLGMGKRMTGGANANTQNQQRTANSQSNWGESEQKQQTASQNDKKKVFDHDEGEYVEFEEIKD